MLIISIVLGIIPLIGVAWMAIVEPALSVDVLFMGLILLTLSGILFLNAFLELRDRGFFKKKAEEPKSEKTKTTSASS